MPRLFAVTTILALAACSNAPSAPVANESSTAAQATDWPQWRGPNRDGISAEKGLLKSWPEGGPKLLWQKAGFGRGYSSVAIAGGKLFTMGTRKGRQMLAAYSLSDLSETWAVELGNRRGGDTRGTPTVDGDLVFGVGTKGDLVCVEISTGKKLWEKNYGTDFGGKMMSGWGYCESPLVDGDQLIVCPGAKDAAIAALDKKTGTVSWKSPLPNVGDRGKDGAGYTGVIISNAGGVKQYIAMIGRGVISVSARDGTHLWSYNRIANGTANIPTPIAWDDFVFCSTGYGTGGALLKIGGPEPREIKYHAGGKFQNHHGGMIRVGNHIYAGHGHNNGLPTCLDARTGEIAWQERGPGKGSAAITFADGHLYFRYEDATMALIEATPDAFKLKGKFTLATKNGKSWSHPVIHDGKLYLRDQNALLCYDIKSNQ